MSVMVAGMKSEELMEYLYAVSGGDIGGGMIEAAMRVLHSPREIRIFYRGYVELVRGMGLAGSVANQNIGYVIMQTGGVTAQKWLDALPEIVPLKSYPKYRINLQMLSRSASARSIELSAVKLRSAD